MRAIVLEDMQTFDARTRATVPSIDRKKIKKVQMIHNWTEEIVLDRSRKPFIAHIYIQQWRKANCNDNKIALSCVVHQLRFCTYRSLWRILLYEREGETNNNRICTLVTQALLSCLTKNACVKDLCYLLIGKLSIMLFLHKHVVLRSIKRLCEKCCQLIHKHIC